MDALGRYTGGQTFESTTELNTEDRSLVMRHPRPSRPHDSACARRVLGPAGGSRGDRCKPEPAQWAATNIEEADPDYAFQGEYYGTLGLVGGGPWQPFGLQVAAQGNGDYIAIEYPGGLPGLGWYGGERAYLRGRREPDRLTLRGDGRRYDIADGLAWFVDENGDKLTWLTKVNRMSRTLGQPAPPNAIVLFDGVKTDQLCSTRTSRRTAC